MTPAEIYFRRAKERGMRCIAITDHHHLDASAEVREIAARYPEIRWIPSAELSVTTSIGGFDLLCYGFALPLSPAMTGVIDRYHAWQCEYGASITRGIRALGHDYTDEDRMALLESYRAERIIEKQGNTHVRNSLQAEYFVKRGFINDVEAYRPLLREAAVAVSPPPLPAVESVVPVVHEAGALIAIAHPCRYFNGVDEKRMETLRAECALDGIECAYPMMPPDLVTQYRAYCVRHDMVSVGGSDCHIEKDLDTRFARHGGQDEWLNEFLARLER